MLKPDWRDDTPIYRQLQDKIKAAILEGSLQEGEPLPSVRTVAVELGINPLTASKAYQELVAEGLVERQRGLGMFVKEGARHRLLEEERTHFLRVEWPGVLARIRLLGLDPRALLAALPDDGKDKSSDKEDRPSEKEQDG
ncbi:MAG: GntR family transcriptional regulator [Alphaproteobacteria bacterium]|nr:MAG: GntR family transcriptional regulator [Alphaproteobacteria bacterium]